MLEYYYVFNLLTLVSIKKILSTKTSLSLRIGNQRLSRLTWIASSKSWTLIKCVQSRFKNRQRESPVCSPARDANRPLNLCAINEVPTASVLLKLRWHTHVPFDSRLQWSYSSLELIKLCRKLVFANSMVFKFYFHNEDIYKNGTTKIMS